MASAARGPLFSVSAAPNSSQAAAEPDDFSLVLGGPLYQLMFRSHLAGTDLELLLRRMALVALLAWFPLLLLVSFSSLAGNGGFLLFLRDIEVHARFLVALPVLIAAELVIHQRLRPVVHRFVEQHLVRPDDMPSFHRAIASAVRLRNSVALELGLLALVYTVGLWLWGARVNLPVATWYEHLGGRWNLTLAGYWYVFISLPVFQFILLRWYLRLFIWFRFLWQVSRLKLNLLPTHPDRAAGLGFLGKSIYAFGPILFAQGAIVAGVVATRIFYLGENLAASQLQIGGFVAFFVVAVTLPLLMFTPAMARARRHGLRDYGLLSQRYVESFHEKWISKPSAGESLLGSSDIQSLADLGNSYSVVSEMRAVPFNWRDVTRLALATAAPFAPLLLTIFSPEELFMRVVKAIF